VRKKHVFVGGPARWLGNDLLIVSRWTDPRLSNPDVLRAF